MKQYKITKIVFARDIKDAFKKESCAEIVDVELNEAITYKDSIGFK